MGNRAENRCSTKKKLLLAFAAGSALVGGAWISHELTEDNGGNTTSLSYNIDLSHDNIDASNGGHVDHIVQGNNFLGNNGGESRLGKADDGGAKQGTDNALSDDSKDRRNGAAIDGGQTSRNLTPKQAEDYIAGLDGSKDGKLDVVISKADGSGGIDTLDWALARTLKSGQFDRQNPVVDGASRWKMTRAAIADQGKTAEDFHWVGDKQVIELNVGDNLAQAFIDANIPLVKTDQASQTPQVPSQNKTPDNGGSKGTQTPETDKTPNTIITATPTAMAKATETVTPDSSATATKTPSATSTRGPGVDTPTPTSTGTARTGMIFAPNAGSGGEQLTSKGGNDNGNKCEDKGDNQRDDRGYGDDQERGDRGHGDDKEPKDHDDDDCEEEHKTKTPTPKPTDTVVPTASATETQVPATPTATSRPARVSSATPTSTSTRVPSSPTATATATITSTATTVPLPRVTQTVESFPKTGAGNGQDDEPWLGYVAAMAAATGGAFLYQGWRGLRPRKLAPSILDDDDSEDTTEVNVNERA